MTLELQNVELRPLQKSDRVALATLANNKKIWDNVRDAMPHRYSLESADFFIDLNNKEQPRGVFAIFYQNEFAGMIGLHLQKDVYRLSAELGYWVGEPFWGKGIATKAVELILKYGFENLNLNRIYAGVFEHNTASMCVLEKCGFVKEGIAKQAVIKNNKVIDEHKFAIIKV